MAPNALPNDPAQPRAQAAAGPSATVRRLGRYQLLRLLGKSARTMAWLVEDPGKGQEFMLVMPRHQPDEQSLRSWEQGVRRAARLNHPQLAQVLEIDSHERWPYVVYERGDRVTWLERIGRQGLGAEEVARWGAQAARGLAYAHEANVAHHDLQPWLLSVNDAGQVTVMGLDVPNHPAALEGTGELGELQRVRDAAGTDLLALGLVLHHALAGQPALDQPDVAHVIERIPPIGADFVRLPWNLPRPIPDPLRAIVNRATDRQPRHRYRNARTLLQALEGWLRTIDENNGGPMALLLDRIRHAGVLPAIPGGADRVAHLALMDNCRTGELADVVLGDMALSFELLRMVNTAQVHGEAVSRDGPVLMLRRAIAMLGLEGVRRAALSIRPWPGPMNDAAAEAMLALIRRVQRAGRVATRLSPAGYDGEVVMLLAQLQNLGRLVVQYHFPDEASQIRRLMQASEPTKDGERAEPGMSAEAASYAVLGLDVEDLGLAVAGHWGLDAGVQQMIRRVPPGAPVHHPEGDFDVLRLTASCANDLVDATQYPARLALQAIGVVVRRYGRALNLTQQDVMDALQAEGAGLAAGAAASSARADPASPPA